MNSFEEYFSCEKIISILCKIRVSNANKRHKKHFYRNISSERPNPHFALPGDEFFPPRKEWKRPPLKERRGRSTSQINLNALEKTISYKIKSGIAQNEAWYQKLMEFIERVKILALQSDDYKISKPCIHPQEKDKDKKTYRLISEYKVLEDKVIIGLTAKYYRDIFDEDFLDCSYAFRGKKDSSQKFPTHHLAVQNIIDYRKNHEGRLLYVAECDIQKFYDVIYHKTAHNSLDRAIKRANDRGIYVDSRAVSVFNSFLESYTFKVAKEEGNKWLEEKGIEGKIQWAEEGLQTFYDRPYDEPIGVPQGGALSPIIANLVLDNADREVIEDLENPDPDLFYARYCDDIIIIHPDERKCEEALDRYLKALDAMKLPEHKPTLITEYSKDYYDMKSKLPFPWSKPSGRKDIVPWISFLGYQVRYDGIIRVRKKSLKKELSKQVQVVDEVIQALKKKEKVSKSKKQILYRVTGKLNEMSVGRIRLGSENQGPQFCWASGFKLLREHDHITSQLKQLDRNRERQISMLKRKLKDYDLEPKAKTKEMKPKPPKYYGAPFSYYASCQVRRSVDEQADNEE